MPTYQYDNGARVDIDTLMARIRKHVQKPADHAPATSSAKPTNSVADALQGQADWNQRVVEFLNTIAETLETQHIDLASMRKEREVDRATIDEFGERSQRWTNNNSQLVTSNQLIQQQDQVDAQLANANERLDGLNIVLANLVSQMAELEKCAAGDRDANRLAFHESLAQLEYRTQATIDQLASQTAESTNALVLLRDLALSQMSAQEQKLTEGLGTIHQAVETRLQLIEEGLRIQEQRQAEAAHLATENMNAAFAELSQRMDTAAAQLSVLEERHVLERQADRQEGQAALQSLQSQWQTKILEQFAVQEQQSRQREENLLGHINELGTRVESAAIRTGTAEKAVAQSIDDMRIRVLRAERKVRAVGPASLAAGATILEPQQSPAVFSQPTSADPRSQAFDYFMFEQRFRGSRDEIKHRQSHYVELFRGRKNVFDLGCGRGEFVELLLEAGIGATGIDANEDMADFCKDRGLPVVRADLFGYLQSQPDSSLDGIIAMQVIEHIGPQEIWQFVLLASRKLQKGGLILLETINANCPAALNWFYLDPTHIRPVPMDLVRFMLEQAEFCQTEFILTAPLLSDGLPLVRTKGPSGEEYARYQDYAAVALRV